MHDSMDNGEDEKEIMKLTTNRIRQQLRTNCFREGTVFGEEHNFQSSFDKGYKDGFGRAYELGFGTAQNKVSRCILKDSVINTSIYFDNLKNLCDECFKK